MWKKIFDLCIALVNNTLPNILAVFSFIFIAVSFLKLEYVDNKFKGLLVQVPNMLLFISGLILLIVAIIIHLIEFKKIKIKGLLKKIDKGFKVIIGGSELNIIFDDIKDSHCSDSQTAIVLPTNDSFDDECINDPTSSLGAFFQEDFKNGIKEIQNLIIGELKAVPYIASDNINTYPLNTIVYLKGPLGSIQQVILVSITTKRKREGIKSDPSYIAKGILEVLKLSADQKLTKLFMPVLGAGHGGVDFNVALHALLFEIMYNFKYKRFHNIKELNIIIFDPKNKLRNETKNTVYCVLEELF